MNKKKKWKIKIRKKVKTSRELLKCLLPNKKKRIKKDKKG